jgi:hypothetical protein
MNIQNPIFNSKFKLLLLLHLLENKSLPVDEIVRIDFLV